MNPTTNMPEDCGLDIAATEDIIESIISLETNLTIQNVVKLHEKLKRSFSVHDAIEINAAQVSSIDTATLQLLLALKKEAIKQQKKIVVTAPSQRFIESVELLGLPEILENDALG